MPKYKNQFKAPANITQEIIDKNGRKVGTIRIKPVGIAWKPANKQEYYSLGLQQFIDWITSKDSGSKKTRR